MTLSESRAASPETTLEFLERIKHLASRAGAGSVSASYATALLEEAMELLAERSRWDINLAAQ